jgi:uncharacterized damage-inducible protein DinB
MHSRLEEVLSYLDSQRAALHGAVELVPAELRNQQPGPDRWSVAQVLEHLVMIEKRIGMGLTKWVSDARDGELGPETETSSVMGTLPLDLVVDRSQRRNAPEEVRPGGEIDAAAAWAALEKTRATLRAGVVAGDGLALGEVIQKHPVLGPINIYQWVLFVGSHEGRHTAQVVEIAAELKSQSNTAASAS